MANQTKVPTFDDFESYCSALSPNIYLKKLVRKCDEIKTQHIKGMHKHDQNISEFDELCDEMKGEWGGMAAGRISAAGMGGRLGIHCRREVVEEVRRWMEKRGWKCRQPKPGAPTQHLSF